MKTQYISSSFNFTNRVCRALLQKNNCNNIVETFILRVRVALFLRDQKLIAPRHERVLFAALRRGTKRSCGREDVARARLLIDRMLGRVIRGECTWLGVVALFPSMALNAATKRKANNHDFPSPSFSRHSPSIGNKRARAKAHGITCGTWNQLLRARLHGIVIIRSCVLFYVTALNFIICAPRMCKVRTLNVTIITRLRDRIYDINALGEGSISVKPICWSTRIRAQECSQSFMHRFCTEFSK